MCGLSGFRLLCAALLGLSFGLACSSSSGHIPKPPSGSVGVAGGYAINFKGCSDTLEEVMGAKPIGPSEMTKKIWAYVKKKRLAKK